MRLQGECRARLSALSRTHSFARDRRCSERGCAGLSSRRERRRCRGESDAQTKEREKLSRWIACNRRKETVERVERRSKKKKKKAKKKSGKKKKKHSRLGEKKEPPRRSKSAFAQMGRGDRPELTAPPEVFYNDEEARKYTTNSRMIEIQVRQGEEWKSIRRRRRRRRLALNLDNLKKKKLKNRPPSPPAPSSSSTSRRTASAASCWTWAAAAASPATPSRTRATSGSEWTSRRRCSASPSSAA